MEGLLQPIREGQPMSWASNNASRFTSAPCIVGFVAPKREAAKEHLKDIDVWVLASIRGEVTHHTSNMILESLPPPAITSSATIRRQHSTRLTTSITACARIT